MKQEWLALGEDFSVEDEEGREAYFVDGRVLSLGDKLSIRDAGGEEVAFVAERLLAFAKTYEIYRAGALAATVRKAPFTLFRCTFTVDVPGPGDLEATGDFLDHEYVIRRGDRVVATVSKRWFSFTDTYGVDVADGEDEVLLLAAAVVIDLCCHDR
jgi:uncharacterized protein YxjI